MFLKEKIKSGATVHESTAKNKPSRTGTGISAPGSGLTAQQGGGWTRIHVVHGAELTVVSYTLLDTLLVAGALTASCSKKAGSVMHVERKINKI